MNKIKERVGEDSSDEALKFLEDMTDTFNDLHTKATTHNKKTDEDWKKEIEEVENKWRTKYRDRFFSGSNNDDDVDDMVMPEVKKPTPEESVTFDDLFTEKEKK